MVDLEKPKRPWVIPSHPEDADMDLFYQLATITIGNGKTATFWHSPWLCSRKPKDIAQSIFAISKGKCLPVQKAM